ncbi:MAG: hypothetical protein EBR82_41425 [Caulobacteraceae bacterium]|nr:hypothetical protein [Caulobacteraceae bacterium]
MTIIKKAAESGSWPLAASQADAKAQLSAMVDGLRQLIGNANIIGGSNESTDPLTAPFRLYVDPYIGRDTFAAGSYNTKEAAAGSTTQQIVDQKLKRLENQRLLCGYSPSRPFKTLNRAIIEAAIITSKNWYISDPLAHVDCVCICLSPALHIIYNNPSSDGAAIAVSQWADNFEPTWQHLISFNPAEGGVLLPRGASIVSLTGDLRHTILRPSWVPNGAVDETPTYANGVATYSLRRQIIKTTGGGYAYGLTFRDQLSSTSSHHLLSAFGHASQSELNAFYANVYTACGSGGNLSQALLVARGTEYTIAAPISGSPTQAWDSTNSASFYIFQCSVRSDYGMGRLWADGSKVSGFKSFVIANYTGVSLQKDMANWQKYSAGSWVNVTDYADYIAQTPDNIRANPARRSIGVAAINEAFVQKVSIFDIGEAVQSLVDTGGEIDCNNGNSSFGGCAGLAKGYRAAALPQDKSWQVSAIRVPLSPQYKTANIQRFYLGTVSAITSSTITLATELAPYGSSLSVPDVLGQKGYSLPSGTYVWIENGQGADWRAPLTALAWSSASPTILNITTAATDPSGTAIQVGGNGISLAIGSRVYVRRLIDTRTPAERRLSLKLSNTTNARIPAAHYVLQTDTASGSISRNLTSSELLLVTSTGIGDALSAGVLKTAEVTLRRGGTTVTYANSTFYRAGTVVLSGNKHWINSKDLTTTTATPDPALWQETYVHMESAFAPEDNLKNEAPVLVFDTDTDGADVTTTCGINWSTAWTASANIYGQYRTGVDYLGAHLLLTALGYSSNDAHVALIPRSGASRNRNPALTSSPSNTLALSSVSPAGGAATGAANWAVEMRRPSTLWLGSHRWFTSGAGNYSKAVPKAAQDMSGQNRFTYLFTGQGGGRVIPQGSQEDGLLVSPRGLEDVVTGLTLSVEDIGANDINTSASNNIDSLTIAQQLTVNGISEFNGPVLFNAAATQQGQTTRLGPLSLAPLSELQKTSINAPLATDDASIDAAPVVVTVAGLNAWRQAQQLTSGSTDEVIVYVKSTAADRDLTSMLATPPISPATAIPSLARAAEYLNKVLGNSEQLGVVRIAAIGLYSPESYWYCNVRFESWNQAFTAMPFPSNSVGNASVANNFYDGTGYDSFTTVPHFAPWRLFVQPANLSSVNGSGNTNLLIMNYPGPLYTSKNVEFVGGFVFLGLSEMIKAVANGLLPKASFIYSYDALWNGVSAADKINGTAASGNVVYSTTVATNVDALLNSIRIATGRNGDYIGTHVTPAISVGGGSGYIAKLYDLMLGASLPTRNIFAVVRPGYIAARDSVKLRIANLYMRGNTTITSTGIGCTNAVYAADYGHHGSAAVPAPWTWRQFHHTLISGLGSGASSLNVDVIGSRQFQNEVGTYVQRSTGADYSYYTDLTGKMLPNSLHLVTNSSTSSTLAYPANDNDGPFLDQVFHAPFGFSWNISHWDVFAAGASGSTISGWRGKFGSNGYNSTKTRGILLGEGAYFLVPEGGSTVSLTDQTKGSGSPIAITGIFQRAGANTSNQANYLPTFTAGAANYGEGNPTGANVVITTADATLGLNIGLRSWRAGVSAQYATIINYNAVF